MPKATVVNLCTGMPLQPDAQKGLSAIRVWNCASKTWRWNCSTYVDR